MSHPRIDSEALVRGVRDLLSRFGGDLSGLEAFFLQLPSRVVVAEAPSGRIILGRRQAEAIWRQPLNAGGPDEAGGPWPGQHEDGRPYQPHEWPLTRALAGEPVPAARIILPLADGSLATVDVSAFPVRDDEGAVVAAVAIFTDVTAQRQAEETLRALNETVVRLSAAVTREDVFDVILHRALAVLGAYAGGVLLLDEERTVLTMAGAVGYPESMLQHYRRVTIDRDVPAAHVVRTGLPVFLGNREEWAHAFNETIAASRTRSAAALPLRAAGETFGVFTLSFDHARRFDPGERAFLEGMAIECAQALERAKLYDVERAARRELEEANQAKDAFLATLSHELRTPLNAILGWTQIARAQAGAGPLAPALQTIERNARAQARLVDEMLDVARIVSGKLQLDTQHVFLTEALTLAVDAIRPSAEAKRVAIETRLDPDTGAVLGDPSRLQQVFANLLSNAVKFTPDGGRIEVRLDRQDAQARIVVTDTGEGVAADVLPHIFERFHQAPRGDRAPRGGLGLGLTIVRHLVDLHGGTVSAESDGPGRGSTFTVRLPLHRQQPREALPAPVVHPPTAPAALDGVRVLVVEDDPDSREFVRQMLTRAGAAVLAVGSAEEGAAAVERQRADVLVVDIGLPGADGDSFLTQMRAREAARGWPAAPAAALTAYSGADDRRRALLAGFDVHLPKPVDAAELAAAVCALARRAGQPPDGRSA